MCAASKGLGRGCALALAREGVNVTLVARGAEALSATAEAIRRETGVKVTTVAADITTPDGRTAALAACSQPDILINNAGGPPPGDFRQFTRDDWIKAWWRQCDTHRTDQTTVDGMIARSSGRIGQTSPLARSRRHRHSWIVNRARSGPASSRGVALQGYGTACDHQQSAAWDVRPIS